jgi:predicted Zn-dependent protease
MLVNAVRAHKPIVWCLLLALSWAMGCAINPATGRLGFVVMGEEEEVELGRQLDQEVVAAIGAYPEPKLQAYVSEVGGGLADTSERADLPWTFRVVDEPVVNAFALPGGYVYVTRGLLAHLDSEAELAAVIAHEIGHVTARHGLDQLRRARAAQRRLFVFRVIDPRARHVGLIAAGTAGALLLRHSREHEHEADDLGLRYLLRAGYDPDGLTEVFGVLERAGEQSEGDRVPAWLSTHPEPQHRFERMSAKIDALGGEVGRRRDAKAYLQQIDGIVFGPDPRQGFFAGRTFIHPKLGYAVDLPEGWKAAQRGEAVVAITEDEEVMLFLGTSDAESAEAGMAEFFEDPEIRSEEQWRGKIDGTVAVSSGFAIVADDGDLTGLVAFLDHGGRVFVMLAVAPASAWSGHVEPVAESLASFCRLRDPKLLGVEPMRIELARLKKATTLEQLSREQPSVVDLGTLAIVNQVDPDERLEPGTLVKRVRGFNPELAGLEVRGE